MGFAAKMFFRDGISDQPGFRFRGFIEPFRLAQAPVCVVLEKFLPGFGRSPGKLQILGEGRFRG